MKAARIFGPHDIRYVEIETPSYGEADVLVRVKRCGVCGTDIAIYSGDMPYLRSGATTYPITPGHEWSGVIEAVGRNVTQLRVGDRVTGDVSLGCGQCAPCLQGDFNLCVARQEVGSFHNKDGAYAEYIAMPARQTYKLPEGASFDAGAMTEPTATVVYTVERVGIKFGDVVVVQGTGSIAILAAQVAQASGASCVIVTGRNDHKLALAREVGIDVTVNIQREDVEQRVHDLTDGRGADVVIEASGVGSEIRRSSRLARLGGRIGVVGIYEAPLESFDMSDIVLNDQTIHGTLASPRVFPGTLRMMAAGRIRCEPLITHRFKLSEAEDAFRAMIEENPTRIKIMLEID
ncbi:MAG: alcohol dehydrogenase catalytic domain-containing protein [Anaerolineales bacterium]|nr:alcohol dehydrogenase catalytic domain-containing protein [Anaerolineales bacterium]